ncbi:signal peptidase I [Dendryphion nanum]|uniref:Signal peptidase complex catalytic subunit SEC11 n=1 Tax=Dendryphion nanum TaxID=256645 RepID=A0A9P9IT18_9PLEO|nr:signal peptidase I [Dendryphion nanum]
MRLLLKRTFPALWVAGAAFMLWKLVCLVTNSPYPIHVVISESMAPAFHRGDIIFLSNWEHEIRVGDIPVVWFKEKALPMVHRAVKINWRQKPGENIFEQLILTKGDNNELDDVALYPTGQNLVRRDQIVGLVRGYLPFLGWISLYLKEKVWIQYALIGGLTLISMIV